MPRALWLLYLMHRISSWSIFSWKLRTRSLTFSLIFVKSEFLKKNQNLKHFNNDLRPPRVETTKWCVLSWNLGWQANQITLAVIRWSTCCGTSLWINKNLPKSALHRINIRQYITRRKAAKKKALEPESRRPTQKKGERWECCWVDLRWAAP